MFGVREGEDRFCVTVTATAKGEFVGEAGVRGLAKCLEISSA